MADADSKSPVRGACLCGAVEYEIRLPTLTCVHCHCSMCRRGNGAGYVTWTVVPSEQLEITSGGGRLTRYQSSDHAARRFCSACGSTLFGESTRTPDLAYIVFANLQGPIDRVPESHSSFAQRVPWVSIDDDLPHTEDAGILETKNG